MTSFRESDRLHELARSMREHWPGRIALGSLAGFGRLDLFDRAMALAAQLFSSVLPLLIMLFVWVGQSTTERFADAVSMPPVAQDVLEQALDESGGSAFGIVGAVFVLLSATSLSRALTRAMASIWQLSRPKTQLTNAWRWLAVVVALVLAAVVTRSLGRFTDPIPPRNAWTFVLTFGLDILVAAFVPWLLLANRVPVRRLIPGGVVFALAMLVVRPASEAYLPRALEESADQYGSSGWHSPTWPRCTCSRWSSWPPRSSATSSPRTRAGWVRSSVAGGRLGQKTRPSRQRRPSRRRTCER